MIELTIRLIGSLAVVVGLLLVTVRIGARKFRPRAGAPVRVLHRQALSRGTSVAVVEVGGRVLVLGATEHQISVLTELDPSAARADEQPGELLMLERSGSMGSQGSAAFSSTDFPALVLAHDAEDPRATPVVLDAVETPAPSGPRHSAPGRRRSTARTERRSPARSGAHAGKTVIKTPARGGARVARPAAATVVQGTTQPTGPLAGSVLSVQTWRQAIAAATGRA